MLPGFRRETADVGEPMTLVLVDLLRNESTFEPYEEAVEQSFVFAQSLLVVRRVLSQLDAGQDALGFPRGLR
jgi:hypothetical protein